MGFTVQQFNESHFRVDKEIDYWLPNGRWYDRVMRDRGQKPLDQLPYFIKSRFEQRIAADEKTFIAKLVKIGWNVERARQAWSVRTFLRESSTASDTTLSSASSK